MRRHTRNTQTLLLLVASTCAQAAFAQSLEHTYTLKKEVLMDTDRCVVVRLELIAEPEEHANNTRLEWRYRPNRLDTTDWLSNSSANGVWPEDGTASRAEILFIAQVTPGNSKHPPMLLFSTKQSSLNSESRALSSQAHRLDEDLAVSDIFHIDIEPGEHPLQEDLAIGELAGKPIHLFFGSDPAYKARILERTSSIDSESSAELHDEIDQEATAG